mmetsp:Transcript_1092/g.1743  ORF Transcript_1092/g.1743 Transcript_1092/m.1743 type:complete len:264 (+) Transcript_1092:2521-3312(+)
MEGEGEKDGGFSSWWSSQFSKREESDEEKGKREVEMVGMETEEPKEESFDIRSFWSGKEEPPKKEEVPKEEGGFFDKMWGGKEEGEEAAPPATTTTEVPSWDRVKSFVTGEEPQEESVVNDMMYELDNGFSLSYEQRLWGFGICVASASVCGILSVVGLFIGDLSLFAIFYTLSNLTYLGSTFFLMGPKAQFERMSDPDRAVATGVFVTSMILTLIAALVLDMALLALFFVIVQSCALFWYSISYIPGARSFIQNRIEWLMGE